MGQLAGRLPSIWYRSSGGRPTFCRVPSCPSLPSSPPPLPRPPPPPPPPPLPPSRAAKTEERKREQDILYERQLVRERAAEDHLYGDKERFVTAAYLAKLEEDRKWEEEERRK